MRYFLLSVLLANFFFSFGQNSEKQLIIDRIAPKAHEILSSGLKFYESEQYAKAIEAFEKIPANDTSYFVARYELALALQADSQWARAIEVVKSVKDRPHRNQPLAYSLLGSVYDKAGFPDSAVMAFNQGLELAPAFYQLHFNKAVTLEKMERYQQAFEAYQQAVYYSPVHVNSNIRLGLMCYKAGLLTEAMMALTRALLSNPDIGLDVIAMMEEISKAEVKAEYTLTQPFKIRAYDDIKMILVNKIALDKKYKLNSKIDYAVVRQLQAMFEKMTYDKTNPNFFNQQYAKLYTQIFAQNQFHGFTAYIFSGIEIPQIKVQVKKYQADAAKFRTWLVANLEGSFNEQTLQIDGTKQLYMHNYDNNFILQGVCKLSNGKLDGILTIYNTSNGRVMVKSSLNDDKREGLTVTYYNNGLVKDSTYWKNNKRNGAFVAYEYDGSLDQRATYKDDVVEGTVYNYYTSGQLYNTIPFKSGKRTGTVNIYYRNGKLDIKVPLVDDLIEGDRFEYFANGALYNKTPYTKDNINGTDVYYFATGQPSLEQNYLNGKLHGTSIWYHNNGVVSKTGQYKDGTQVGHWKIYDRTGRLIEDQFIDETGKLNGTIKEYGSNGAVTREMVYVKGELQSYKCFDLKGKLLAEHKRNKGVIKYVDYYEDGTLFCEGQRTNDNNEGEWKYYHTNGVPELTLTYNNGEQTGIEKRYFQNGTISEEYDYSGDKKNGLFIDYYSNGAIRAYAYFINGSKNGFEEKYNSLGFMNYKNYFLDGSRTAEQFQYTEDGKLKRREVYKDNFITESEDFDSLGNSIFHQKLKPGRDTIISHHVNGALFAKLPVNNFINDGANVWYHANGKIQTTGFSLNAERDSFWIWYDYKGNKETQIPYLAGRIHGEYSTYHPNGQVKEKGNYLYGQKEGDWTLYFENGKPEIQRTFFNGDIHGKVTYYHPSGEVIRFGYFENGDLVAYSYLDKNGQEVEKIPVKRKGAFTVVAYFRNGEKSCEIPLKDGWYHGTFKSWHPNGKEWRVNEYQNDSKNGAARTYHENGQLAIEQNWFHGNLHGEQKKYNDKGVLLSVEPFFADNLHGEANYIDNKVIKRVRFYHGEWMGEK